jgi:hypothetical protein
MIKRFFSYDPGDRMRYHATAEEAKAEAQHAFDLYRDEAGEGWDESVDEVMWGEIKELVQMTSTRPYDPEKDSHIDSTLCDEVVEYDLKPIPE